MKLRRRVAVVAVFALLLSGYSSAGNPEGKGFTIRWPKWHTPHVDLSSPMSAIGSSLGAIGHVISQIPGEIAAVATNAGHWMIGSVGASVAHADPQPDTVIGRSAGTDFFRRPDGSQYAKVYPSRVNHQTSPGVWVPNDNSLIADATGWHNAANEFSAHFGNLGNSPQLLTLTWGSTSVQMSLAGAQPVEPSVSGSTITYASILPNTDLSFTVDDTGVRKSIELNTAPNQQPQYVFHLLFSGLTSSVQTHEVDLVGADGFGWQIAAPWMAETPVDPVDDPLTGPVNSLLSGAGATAKDLTITPDLQWLSDASRVYPVTIDPQFSQMSQTGSSTYPDTWIGSDYATSPQNSSVNLYAGTNNSGTTKRRSYLKFDVSSLTGKTIQDASLAVYEDDSASCTPYPIDLDRIRSSWPAGIVWNDAQPSIDTGAPVASLTTAKGYSSSCPAGTLTFSSAGLGTWVDNWANNSATYPNYGLALYAAETGTTQSFKRFRSAEYGCPTNCNSRPTLLVNYNTPPGPSSSLAPGNGTVAATTTPQLGATFTDADAGSTGYVQYEIYDANSQLVTSANGNTVGSGSRSNWSVPANVLNDGSVYSWRARSYDFIDYSVWSALTSFTPDISAPTGLLTAPANESTLAGVVSLVASPTDGSNGSGVQRVDFYAMSLGRKTLIASDTTGGDGWTASLDSRTLPDGPGIISAEYVDALGNSSCCAAGAQAAVVVDNATSAPEPWQTSVKAPGFAMGQTADARVVLSSGALVLGINEGTIPGPSFDAMLQASYNSRSQASGTLGTGWRSTLQDTLASAFDGSVTHVDGAGREERFSPRTSPGVLAQYWNNTNLNGTSIASTSDSQISFNWNGSSPTAGVTATNWSARWTGLISIPTAGNWTFYASTDDGDRVLVDGDYVVNDWRPQGLTETPGSVYLSAGLHTIGFEYFQASGPSAASLSWAGPGVAKQIVPASALSHATGAYDAPAGIYDALTLNADGTFTVTSKDQVVTRYLVSGQLDKRTDGNGNVFGIAYDASNRPTAMCFTSPCTVGSGAITFSYNGNGQVSSAADSDGRSWTFSYQSGRLTSIQNPDGGVDSFSYSANGVLTDGIDAEGNHSHLGYDATNRVTSAQDPEAYAHAGPAMSVEYDTPVAGSVRIGLPQDPVGPTPGRSYGLGANGELLSFKSELNRTTTYTYDSNFNEVSETDPMSHVYATTYDSRGNKIGETDPDGNHTSYAYDGNNNLVSETDPRGKVTSYTYDSHSNRTSETDPAGNKITYGYNGLGLRTTETDPRGNVSGGNPAAYTTTYTFDATGNIATETDPQGHVTSHTYDPAGNELTETDPDGLTTTYTYSWFGGKLSETGAAGDKRTFAYDKLGHQTQEVDPRGNVAGGNPTAYLTTDVYDDLGRLSQTTDPAGHNESNAYDLNGNLVSETDALGHSTTLSYNSFNQLTTVTDPNGSITTFTYDNAGRKSAVTDPKGTTTFGYDAAGNLTSETDPLGNTTTYVYDAAGNMASVTDAGGNLTSYVYDDLNRRTSETNPLGKTTSITYDVAGNPATSTDPNGNTTSFTYDSLGREVRRDTPGNVSQNVIGSADVLGTTTFDAPLTSTKAGTITAALSWDKTQPLTQQNQGQTLNAGANVSYTLPAEGQSILSPSMTWQKGDTTQSQSLSGAVTASGQTTAGAITVSSTATPITGSLSWATFSKSVSGSGSVAAVGSSTRSIAVQGAGQISVSVTWANDTSSTLTPQTHLSLSLTDTHGNVVAQNTNGTQPASVSYNVPSGESGNYTLTVTSKDLGASYSYTGYTPTYANLGLQLIDPQGNVAASANGPTQPVTVTYQPTTTGSYSWKVVSLGDPSPNFTVATTYPIQAFASLRMTLFSPNGSTLQTATSGTGSLSLPAYLASNPGGNYHVQIDNLSSWAAPFTYQGRITTTTPAIRSGSLGTATQSSHTFTADGPGDFRADLDWQPGPTASGQTFTGSFPANSTQPNSHQVNVTSTQNPVTGSLKWQPHTLARAASGSVSALGTSTSAFFPSDAPGQISASITWSNATSSTLTAQTHLEVAILDPSGNVMAQNTAGTQGETVTYQVPAGAGGNYQLQVHSRDLGANYSATINYPVYSTLRLQLLDPAGNVVSDTSARDGYGGVSANFTPTSTGTYTFKASTPDSDPTPQYTLTTTYSILSYANVVAKIYDPSGALLGSTSGRPGIVTVPASSAGTFRVDVVNSSTGTNVPSYTLTAAPPTSRVPDFDLSLVNSSGTTVAQATDHSARPEQLTYLNAPAGSYTLHVIARAYAGPFTLEYGLPTVITTTTSFDPAGLLGTTGSPSGTQTYAYDPAGRLKQVTLPNGNTQAYTYFENDLVKTAKDAAGKTATYAYNAENALTSTTYNGVSSTYGLDANGNQTSVAIGSLPSFTYGYDNANQMTSRVGGGTTTFGYGDLINRTKTSSPNGDTDVRQYDSAGRLTDYQFASSDGGAATFQMTMTYDARNRRLTRRQLVPGPATTLATYSYDANGRLSSETIPGQPQAFTYNYDDRGNRIKRDGGSGAVTIYTYSVGDRLVSRLDPTGNTTTYLYDGDGRLTKSVGQLSTTQYYWDSQNQLTEMSSGGTDIRFTYDSEGRRISKTSSGQLVETDVYDANKLASLATPSGTTAFTYDGQGAPLSITTPTGGPYYYHYDERGSVATLTNASHAVVAAYTYDAWGNVLTATGQSSLMSVNPYTFRGQYRARFDTDLSLFIMGQRYYDAASGRFISRDPLETDASASPYVYSANDPVNMKDPEGTMPMYDHDSRPNDLEGESYPRNFRIQTVEGFFTSVPGTYTHGRFGLGRGIRDFTIWEARSNRLDPGSGWWRGVNGRMVYDMRLASADYMYHLSSSNKTVRPWLAYIKSAMAVRNKFIAGKFLKDWQNTQTLKDVWTAHQYSIHGGVHDAYYAGLYDNQNGVEQSFIALVVRNVDTTALNGVLRSLIRTNAMKAFVDHFYPRHFPAWRHELNVAQIASVPLLVFNKEDVGLDSRRWN